MKAFASLFLCLPATALLLSQCSSPSRPLPGPGVVGQSTATMQNVGDTTAQTRTLIHHPLTNADSGKTYQEITVNSPRGTFKQKRVIVQATPSLETRNVTMKGR